MGSLDRFDLCSYKCNIYVETGTGIARCLTKAVNSNCFDHFFSVDLDKELVENAKKMFPFATIENSISTEALEKWLSSKIIADDDNILFFLDAHFPGTDWKGEVPDVSKPNAVPLEEEIKIIKKHRPKGKNYIICDDARIYKPDNYEDGNFEWPLVPNGMSFLYNIFPEYKIQISLWGEGYILIDDR